MADKTYLDWPFLDDSHRDLKSNLVAWCERHSFDHGENVDDICRQLVVDLGKAGWLENCVPRQWGGASEKLDVRSIALCRETLAYYSGLADFSFAMQGLGSGAISLCGTDAQRQQYLPAVAAGTAIAAFALSEAKAGSDVAAIATSAELSGDEYVLNGEKTWISNGGIADFYCVFARTGEEPGARGLSAFIVDASNPGLEVTEKIETIAPHPLAVLSLNDCRVAVSARIGEPGEGFKIAMATLDVFRTTVAAAALGFARRALDEAVRHTSTRELFGAPLSALQMTEASIAEMKLRWRNCSQRKRRKELSIVPCNCSGAVASSKETLLSAFIARYVRYEFTKARVKCRRSSSRGKLTADTENETLVT